MSSSLFWFRYISLLLLASLLQQVFAQRIIGRFETLSVEQGLSQSTIQCILQDQQGFMWFGTESGLNRYDGYDFVTFKFTPDDTGSLSNNLVNDMARDHKGNIWIATAGGLCRYNTAKGDFSRFYFKQKTNSHNFYKILVDSEDNIWLLSAQGVIHFDIKKENLTLHPISRQNQFLQIMDFKEAENGFLILATEKGLFTFSKMTKNIAPVISDARLTKYSIKKLLKEKKDIWWIATDRGLFRYNFKKSKVEPIKLGQKKVNGILEFEINFIHQDSEGLLWIGFDGGGLSCYNPAKQQVAHFQQYSLQRGGLSSNFIQSVYEDDGGILWFGTIDAGVIKLVKNNNGFIHYKIDVGVKQNFNHDVVFSFAEDEAGDVWIGTLGGLVRFDLNQEKFTQVKEFEMRQKSFVNVYALAIDHQGKLWVGTYDKGLYYYDKKTRTLKKYQGIINKQSYFKRQILYKIVEDKNHCLWICSSNGLFYLNPRSGEYKHFVNDPSDPTSLGANFVRDLFIDKNDQVWVGTMGGGLNQFLEAEDNFYRYINNPGDAQSISNNQVTSITQDSIGYIWIGTNGGGLNRFNPESKKFMHLPKRHSLSGEVIYDIVKEGQERLWIASARGLYRFNVVSKNIVHYDKYDGLQSTEFNAGAAIKLKSGVLLFGGINGFNMLTCSDSLKKNSHIPQVKIIDIKIYDRSLGLKRLDGFVPLEKRLPEKNKIFLDYTQNSFTIDFSALDFEAPHKNVYIYHLLNFEKKWFYAKKHRSATFTNVPPGEYVFEVKGSNNDLVWNTNATRLFITIEPPFWQTIWFRAFILLLGVLVLYALYYLRIRFIQHKNKELEDINRKLNLEVAERQDAQKAMNESERRLATLIKNLPGIAYRCKNNSERTMEFVNEGCFPITGYRPETFINDPQLAYSALVHPDDKAGMLLEIEEKIFRKAPFQIIYRIISSTRQIKWMWEQGRGIYNEHGKLIAVEGFIIDISERKQLEEQLVQAQKMEAVGHLAGGIAHDFNNLLTIIRGYSELSLVMLDKELPVYKKIFEISKAVDRAESLTQQLLAFSRKQVLKPVPFSLNKQIKETEKMLRRLIGEHIQLYMKMEAKSDTIKADPGKIEQIILNLSINARDAMPGGGTLTISTSNVILDDDFSGFRPELKAGRYVMLSISDTGTGMDEETKEHIFDPFFTTKDSGKGTGLGLATVYGIVKQSRGHITVASQPGAGTTFMIYFPRVRDEIIISEDVGKVKGDLKGNETILLVEDKKEVRQVIFEALEFFGYNVIQAEDGKQAIKLFEKQKDKISLLLTDIIMPGMNGRDLAIKLMNMDASLKVIYISGYTDDMLGEDGNLDPEMHFIQKPFTTLLLARKLREVLD